MKTYKLYSAIKSYLALGVAVLSLTIFNVSAFERNNDGNGQSHHAQRDKSGQGSHSKDMKKRFKMLANKLALSQVQRQEIRTIFTEMKADKKTRRTLMLDFKQQVGTLAKAAEFDEEKFKALYIGFQDQFQRFAMEKAKLHHAVMQILTPEQQDKFSSLRGGAKALF